jgi:hypothetical protein
VVAPFSIYLNFTEMIQRLLKVGAKATRPTRYKRIINFHPKIDIAGKWLQDAGFEIGEGVRVIVEPDFIRIEKIGNEHPTSEAEPEGCTDLSAFVCFLDALYYEGYTDELQFSNVELYNFELNNYLHHYGR